MYKKVLVLIGLYMMYFTIQSAAQEGDSHILYFRQGVSCVEADYRNNSQSLSVLKQHLDSLKSSSTTGYCIEINASSSPDGAYMVNKLLLDKRLRAMGQLVSLHMAIPDSTLILKNNGIGWNRLKEIVYQHPGVPFKERVLAVLEHTPEFIFDTRGNLIDGRKKQLMEVGMGESWRWMESHLFDELRNGRIVTFTNNEERDYNSLLPEVAVNREINHSCIRRDSLRRDLTQVSVKGSDNRKRAPLAIKTNLLFDLATALNIEIEIPVGRRWSVAGEWIFPWWSKPSKHRYCQVLSGNLECRYWLGERAKRSQLTGWYGGIYAGGGYYDIMFNKDHGYQGEFYIVSGIGAGYAHTINKSGTLRMEYSLGVGYLKTNYRKYSWDGYDYMLDAPTPQSWDTSWIGPTRAKVSLVWMINLRRKQGGAG